MHKLGWNELQKDLLRVVDIAGQVFPDLLELMEETMSTALPAIHLQITLALLPLLGCLHNRYNHVPKIFNKFMYVAEKRKVIMLHSPVRLTAVFCVLQTIHGNHSMSCVVLRFKASFSGLR
jgi:hypothetical protein